MAGARPRQALTGPLGAALATWRRTARPVGADAVASSAETGNQAGALCQSRVHRSEPPVRVSARLLAPACARRRGHSERAERPRHWRPLDPDARSTAGAPAPSPTPRWRQPGRPAGAQAHAAQPDEDPADAGQAGVDRARADQAGAVQPPTARTDDGCQMAAWHQPDAESAPSA